MLALEALGDDPRPCVPGLRPGVVGWDRPAPGLPERGDREPRGLGGFTPDKSDAAEGRELSAAMDAASAAAGAPVRALGTRSLAAACAAACTAAAWAATASLAAAAAAATASGLRAAFATPAAAAAFAVDRAVSPPDEEALGGSKGKPAAPMPPTPPRRGILAPLVGVRTSSAGLLCAKLLTGDFAGSDGAGLVGSDLKGDSLVVVAAATAIRFSRPSFVKKLTQPSGAVSPSRATHARFVPSGSSDCSRMCTLVPDGRLPASLVSRLQPERIFSLPFAV